MLVNHMTVVVVATLAALGAGGGVVALTREQAPAGMPILRSADGHFWADGVASSETGHAHVRFLVDTGASSVALSAEDASRLGLAPARLDYSRPVYTAQGETKAAAVTLSHLEVGGVELGQVNALVLKEGPQVSLLGMSFLGRLSKVEATPNDLKLLR